MVSAPDDTLYHQTKTPISFWCRQGLNPRSLIQPSKTLPVELTGTHVYRGWMVQICMQSHAFSNKPSVMLCSRLSFEQVFFYEFEFGKGGV